MGLMAVESVPVVFSLQELWYLRSVVRHETSQQRQWTFPPASLSLSDQIAEALYLCSAAKQPEACLQLSRGDCLVLDYVVSQDAKDAQGMPLGVMILSKVITARVKLASSEMLECAEPPDQPSSSQVRARLQEQEEGHD